MSAACPEEMFEKYYLVRKGTNARLTASKIDPTHLIVEEWALEQELAHYRDVMRYEVQAMTVLEWHERYARPVTEARAAVWRSVHGEPKDAGANEEASPQ